MSTQVWLPSLSASMATLLLLDGMWIRWYAMGEYKKQIQKVQKEELSPQRGWKVATALALCAPQGVPNLDPLRRAYQSARPFFGRAFSVPRSARILSLLPVGSRVGTSPE